MNKQDAKKELQALKNREKELTEIIESPEAPETIMEKVKTYEDACKVLNLPTTLPDVSIYAKDDRSHAIADFKLIRIIRALNEGWKPNWRDANEYKWYPFFDLSSGFGFSATDCGWTHAYSAGGSRLCLKNEELAKYAGKQFEAIYKDFIVI